MGEGIAFIDSEISVDTGKIMDLGAINSDGKRFHGASIADFTAFISGREYLCGHNIIAHDIEYISKQIPSIRNYKLIDTLAISPLLFPQKPYHRLLKDDKLQGEDVNNPLNDALKARELFEDEIVAFKRLPVRLKMIYCSLLYRFPEFKGFFDYVAFKPTQINESLIKNEFSGRICSNANLAPIIKSYPRELAYALAIISTQDSHSITPPWVIMNYPKVDNVVRFLCGTPCNDCIYCKTKLNVNKALKHFFGYDSFRTYNGEPLQENAARYAVQGNSLLAVFPTGGGKSIAFQLPALMAGSAVRGLTVVISPLQSLMKDQVDNLEEQGIADAVTINGLLSPIERAEAIERVQSGIASMLYISPEQLRSRTIEKLLMTRNVVRFVIDEAHCFSAWGQDFRVDYLYIGDFIRELQKNKNLKHPIPVSCFTATAKQKVITDITEYFKRKLDIDLKLFATTATRQNLHYAVLYKETEEEKYSALRSLIEQKNCPTIVYVSRTRRTFELANKLTRDGFTALPFNGRMEPQEKTANQEAFMSNAVKIMVATSAFGMGVDKSDVGLVIHYDISDSLENYVQEAGRAGRNSSLQADCYVLFNDNDLDKHFILLNQTKLSISEIQQVWKAVKDLTRHRPSFCRSALEIARQAGWETSATAEMETRVRTAISALETAGYLKRGKNVPHIYASSILAKNMSEATAIIEKSSILDDKQKDTAKRIIKSLISSRSRAIAGNDDAESRVDYLADMLGLEKENVIQIINIMRQDGLLQDALDMSAYIRRSESRNKSLSILERFLKLERFLLDYFSCHDFDFNIKELNEVAHNEGVAASSVKNIRTLLYYWTIKSYIRKEKIDGDNRYEIRPQAPISSLGERFELKAELCRFIVGKLYELALETKTDDEDVHVEFSLLMLLNAYNDSMKYSLIKRKIQLQDVEDSLLYLSKIGAVNMEGGFLVVYNGMEIKRIVVDNKIKYKAEDYRLLSEFYKQKIQQIHIVGEYANLMVRDYDAAIQYVQDYFQMDFKQFIKKYFKGERAKEIDRNMTPEKYNRLFGELSDIQSEIINDKDSRYIVVAAGPGSGKTRVLVHKLASLLWLEDVKHEQLLMLTFSRAAATEFKMRLMELVGNAAHFTEIKTFHSYCFDLLGKKGSLDDAENIVGDAARIIENGEVEIEHITKTVLVIDEAQDMDENEIAIVRALMSRNDDMRIIAVGDDDQNIYEFRGSDSKNMRSLITDHNANVYEMNENYRSAKSIVAFSNSFAMTIKDRMKSGGCIAHRDDMGRVCIVHHETSNLEVPIVNHIMQNPHSGRTAVLTCTNDEALRVLGLLNKNGINAKLIQSNDGFNLYNLAEIRFFLKTIDSLSSDKKISEDVWHEAVSRLNKSYFGSTCLDLCMRMITDFAKINRDKYRTDLEEFIKESSISDFYDSNANEVIVSTVHKSKGREYDRVYLMMNNPKLNTDEERRKTYVAITRAKDELYIHCNNDAFSRFNTEGVEHIYDDELYPEPDEIVLQLTHKDVYLSYFNGKKKQILNKMKSGDELNLDGDYMTAEIDGKVMRILKLSKACSANIDELKTKGYSVGSASVRFIVAWKGEGDLEESAIILPDLCLKRG